MYTVCPGCTRQFQIHAEHLGAASGQVRCGFCHELFNATERLYDEPLSNEEILNDQLEPEEEPPESSTLALEQEQVQEIEPNFDIPEKVEAKIVEFEEDVLINMEESDADDELETAINEIGIRPSVEELKKKLKKETLEFSEPKPELEPEPEPKHEPDLEIKLELEENAVEKVHYEFPEPEALFEEEPAKSSWGWLPPFFWATTALFALLILVSQLAWFNRDRLLLDYPELKPYAKQICEKLACKLIRQRDVRAIKLINRDVRLHPDYQNTLLVNVAMQNELSVRQPYPRIQLTLFDTSGSLLAYREFVPNDYLDDSIEIDAGMPMDSPVYFVLEVSGPTAGAVGFEFRFL